MDDYGHARLISVTLGTRYTPYELTRFSPIDAITGLVVDLTILLLDQRTSVLDDHRIPPSKQDGVDFVALAQNDQVRSFVARKAAVTASNTARGIWPVIQWLRIDTARSGGRQIRICTR